MNKVFIERLSTDDIAAVDDIHVSCDQSVFVSTPLQVMNIIREVGDKKINIPFRIKRDRETAGFFTLNFFSPIAVQADPLYFGGEYDCRLESFMVDKRVQRQGVGTAAINEIIELLKKDFPHIKGLKLTVNLLNKGAKLFYLNCGFRDTGDTYDGGPAGPQHIYRLDIA